MISVPGRSFAAKEHDHGIDARVLLRTLQPPSTTTKPTMSATGSAISAGSRVRSQGRKKALDDAAYFGPPTSTIGNKRQATEKADGDTSRVKRKKTDVVNMQNGFNNVYSKRDEVEPKAFLVRATVFFILSIRDAS